jgi:hypothetical protein
VSGPQRLGGRDHVGGRRRLADAGGGRTGRRRPARVGLGRGGRRRARRRRAVGRARLAARAKRIVGLATAAAPGRGGVVRRRRPTARWRPLGTAPPRDRRANSTSTCLARRSSSSVWNAAATVPTSSRPGRTANDAE